MRTAGGYKVDEWPDKFFGDSIDDFVSQLEMENLSDEGREVIEFLKKYKARQASKECVDFEVLKVWNLNGGWISRLNA
jgi:hypothetical protein